MPVLARIRSLTFVLLVASVFSAGPVAQVTDEPPCWQFDWCGFCDSENPCWVGSGSCSQFPGCTWGGLCTVSGGTQNLCDCTPCPVG